MLDHASIYLPPRITQITLDYVSPVVEEVLSSLNIFLRSWWRERAKKESEYWI